MSASLAEQIAAALEEQADGATIMVLMARDLRSAICVRCQGEMRSRGYGYNVNDAAPEWASGWALSMGWRLLKALEEQRAGSPS